MQNQATSLIHATANENQLIVTDLHQNQEIIRTFPADIIRFAIKNDNSNIIVIADSLYLFCIVGGVEGIELAERPLSDDKMSLISSTDPEEILVSGLGFCIGDEFTFFKGNQNIYVGKGVDAIYEAENTPIFGKNGSHEGEYLLFSFENDPDNPTIISLFTNNIYFYHGLYAISASEIFYSGVSEKHFQYPSPMEFINTQSQYIFFKSADNLYIFDCDSHEFIQFTIPSLSDITFVFLSFEDFKTYIKAVKSDGSIYRRDIYTS